MPGPARPSADAMLGPLARLLRPLVRLLIQCGVSYPAAADLLRTLYVDVASRDLAPGERTDSRVSLLTGVHRKEISRLRIAGPAQAEPPVVTRTSRLIGTWLGSPDYADASGAPRALPRLGPAPSFEHLVQAVTRDVRPRAMLDDLLAQRMVSMGEDGVVRLRVEALLPSPGRSEQLFYFGRNLHDHAAAAAANVVAEGPAPFLDRTVHYDGLSCEAAATLEHHAREVAVAALLDVNRRAVALGAAEPPPGAATRRVNFGIYVFVADDERADDERAGDERADDERAGDEPAEAPR